MIIAVTLLLKGKQGLSIDLKDVPYMAFLATIGISAALFLQAWSLEHTTVTNFTMISSLSTFAVMLLSLMIIGEKLSKDKIIGVAIAFAGLALITTNGRFELSAQLKGDIIALTSAFFWALYTVMGKKISEKYSALTVLSYVFLFASIEFLPFYLMSPHTSMFEFTPLTWESLGFLTICCSLIAFLVYNFSLDKLSASTVAMTIYITPLSGVFLGAVLLGESFTAYTLVGSLLIITGLYKAESKSICTYRRSVPLDT
ncbi:Permease of the drug/metabolite transporter (DMT) superfamily [Methanosarcina mazei TMA]|nr:DMT family transporter [Methanosarcina mazei]UWJ23462.1 Permease of the drug/metabolite transporter (DMT) superfamily [Methanosarcina mazei TMA]